MHNRSRTSAKLHKKPLVNKPDLLYSRGVISLEFPRLAVYKVPPVPWPLLLSLLSSLEQTAGYGNTHFEHAYHIRPVVNARCTGGRYIRDVAQRLWRFIGDAVESPPPLCTSLQQSEDLVGKVSYYIMGRVGVGMSHNHVVCSGQGDRTVKVLIAEDDTVSRRLLEVTLTRWGYEVAVTRDGVEAWEVLQGLDAPPLAILDWMPARWASLIMPFLISLRYSGLSLRLFPMLNSSIRISIHLSNSCISTLQRIGLRLEPCGVPSSEEKYSPWKM